MENIFGVMGRGGDKLVDAVDGKKSSNEPPQGSSLLNMASESRASHSTSIHWFIIILFCPLCIPHGMAIVDIPMYPHVSPCSDNPDPCHPDLKQTAQP